MQLPGLAPLRVLDGEEYCRSVGGEITSKAQEGISKEYLRRKRALVRHEGDHTDQDFLHQRRAEQCGMLVSESLGCKLYIL
jgi:hypothetical protein